jgi:hypothetical protein
MPPRREGFSRSTPLNTVLFVLICHDYLVLMLHYVIVISLVLLIFPRKPSESVLGTLCRDGLGADDLVSQEIEGMRCL